MAYKFRFSALPLLKYPKVFCGAVLENRNFRLISLPFFGVVQTIILASVLYLAACTEAPKQIEDAPKPLTLSASSFADLPGWQNDNIKAFVPAFQKSCARFLKGDPAKAAGSLAQAGTYAEWQPACRTLGQINIDDNAAIRSWAEQHFLPYAVSAGGDPNGLFTGYYEASLRGSLTRSERYNVPLYTRPDDLVMVNLGEFRESLKGERIAGRVQDGQLKPYESRAEIVAGAWPHNDKVLVWVDDAVDAFFVQIQGSGVVELEDGGIMRIGYAGQNGHVYTAIGRELIARGAVAKEDMSMQAIRDWLEANPAEADALMNTNESYVFFQTITDEGPKGGEGVALTPERSLAVDHSLWAYGVPLWVDIEAPPGYEGARLQHLMVAQDTGGAIRGPVRGDVFWGYGERAEVLAGPMKSSGRYWVLLPK